MYDASSMDSAMTKSNQSSINSIIFYKGEASQDGSHYYFLQDGCMQTAPVKPRPKQEIIQAAEHQQMVSQVLYVKEQQGWLGFTDAPSPETGRKEEKIEGTLGVGKVGNESNNDLKEKSHCNEK